MGSRVTRTATMANAPDVQNFIKNAVSQDKVVIFSKTHCPYCKLAKDIFMKINQPIRVYELDELDDGAAIQANLPSITGIRTVPQVFINGNCVGGGTDIQKLHNTGKLEPILIG